MALTQTLVFSVFAKYTDEAAVPSQLALFKIISSVHHFVKSKNVISAPRLQSENQINYWFKYI